MLIPLEALRVSGQPERRPHPEILRLILIQKSSCTMEPSPSSDDQPSPVIHESADDFLARWQRQEEDARIDAGKRLAVLFARVRQVQPTWGFLVAGYSGSGDSGSFEYVGFVESRTQADDATCWETPPGLQRSFPAGITEAELGELLDHFLPSGYEINDGGQGVVRIELATGKIDVAHDWCVSEVESDPRSFSLDVVTGTLSDKSAPSEA